MRNCPLVIWLAFLALLCPLRSPAGERPPIQKVFVLPIRSDISTPLVYVVRRGVKAAMDAKAQLLVVDMETDGGRVDAMVQIIESLNQFPGETVTYVNRKAFSAGAMIAVATQKIFMAPETVIGAAAPIMIAPGGAGVQEMPSTVEVKMTSAISAEVRTYAQKHGHNAEVVQAMIDKQTELVVDGHVLNPKGKILTLTNREAETEYGDPPKPLLSLGTVETLDGLLDRLGAARAEHITIQPTGAERLASWINALDWLWLIIGAAGIYIEFKTPGVILPGIVGLCGIALYFLGNYVAGLSGLEWAAIFLLGLILVGLELLAFPGTVALGVAGSLLMLISLVMALVDIYPGMPPLPSLPQLELPVKTLSYAGLGSLLAILALSRWLPRTSIYSVLVSHSASGTVSVEAESQKQASRVGDQGIALSVLRPGGKAQFGEEIVDVITEGEMLPRGTRVRIIAHSGREAIVAAVSG